MPISVSATPKTASKPSPKNAFERTLDSTDPRDTMINNAIRAASDVKRWKVKGPWLVGMEAGEFTNYVRREISQRKAEFQKYLNAYIKARVTSAKKMMAMDRGNSLSDAEIEVTQADYDENLKLLRQDAEESAVESELCTRVIMPFLDLPPLKVENRGLAAGVLRGGSQGLSPDSIPLTTHPSAGLSYLRSKSYLTNHPVLGPQEKPPPVPARVLTPQQNSTGGMNRAKLGVAGIVTEDSASFGWNAAPNRQSSVSLLDIETYGGQKIWVEPRHASISPTGKIVLETMRAEPYAVQVEMGELEEKAPQRPPTMASRPSNVGPDGRPRMDEPLDGKPAARASEIGGPSEDRIKKMLSMVKERVLQQQQQQQRQQ